MGYKSQKENYVIDRSILVYLKKNQEKNVLVSNHEVRLSICFVLKNQETCLV